MPKQAVNPRRFSKADFDPDERVVTHISLWPKQGSETACVVRLQALLRQHPNAIVAVTGIATVKHRTKITIGVDLGPNFEAMRLASQARYGIALIRALMPALYDFWPTFSAEPQGFEAEKANAHGTKYALPKNKRRKTTTPSVNTNIGAGLDLNLELDLEFDMQDHKAPMFNSSAGRDNKNIEANIDSNFSAHEMLVG